MPPQRKPIRVTDHVVIRYQERVRPTLNIDAAKRELLRVLEVAKLKPARSDGDADAIADLGDIGILLMDKGRYYVATTAVARRWLGPEERAKRNARNQDTRTRRQRSRQKGRKHQDSRTQTARRSEPVHEDILGAEEPRIDQGVEP